MLDLYNTKLSIDEIFSLRNELDWIDVVQTQTLSEDDIVRFEDYVDFKMVSKYQKLSEEFIVKYEDKLDWSNITRYQSLSEEFIDKYKEHIDCNIVMRYQNVSDDFVLEYYEKIPIVHTFLFHHQLFYLYKNHKLYSLLSRLSEEKMDINNTIICPGGVDRLVKVDIDNVGRYIDYIHSNIDVKTITKKFNITTVDFEYMVKFQIRQLYYYK